ncbi:hypothetical protein [Coleofasciculus sp. E1-EBD-02]|uniref:hypothetical protein n=1 Tax=Coleofasciculus sp. E1-EBD-02 TaxID=3068481 RepID=UPI0032FE2904
MFYRIWQRCFWGVSLFLGVFSLAVAVAAQPAPVFIPFMGRIQKNLPVGLAMRLPTELRVNDLLDIDPNQLIVRVFPSEAPPSYMVSLFTCDRSPNSCLLGSFSVHPKQSASARRDLQRHETLGDRITLTPTVAGYLIEGPQQNPSYPFSTVMWQQNEMIYTISFPAIERQNILYMALSMAREQGFYRR